MLTFSYSNGMKNRCIGLLTCEQQKNALDIVQETAYLSYKNIYTLKEQSWLIRIAYNCSMDLLRKKSKVAQLNSEFEGKIPFDKRKMRVPNELSERSK